MTAVPATRRLDLSRIARAGLSAAAIAVVVNSLVALVARAALDIDPGFLPLQPGPVFVVTLGAVLAGTAVYALLARFTPRPNPLFVIMAWGFALLTTVPLLGLGGDAPEIAGSTGPAVAAAVSLHLIPAAVLTTLLTRSTGRPSTRKERSA